MFIDQTKCPMCGAQSFRTSGIGMYVSIRIVKYRCTNCGHEHKERETDFLLKNKIVFMKEKKFSIREIAYQLKIPRQRILEVWKKYCRGGK